MAWRPSGSIEMLHARAKLLTELRSFFAQRRVLEVETPLIGGYAVTDPNLASVAVHLSAPGLSKPMFLQTSPEFHMKRLLAAGSGDIFQIARVVRDDELGRKHNPEFSMLEWYRLGFDEHQLMDEIDQLLQRTLQAQPAQRLSYQQVFQACLGVDPLQGEGVEALRTWLIGQNIGEWVAKEPSHDVLLDLAMSHYIEPTLGFERPLFIYDFPASQSALAQISQQDPRVARRFEVYVAGTELANGFYELTDPEVQRTRFMQDNKQRELHEKPQVRADSRLLDALGSGLPPCAGVALGIDRLLMLQQGASDISEVMAFSMTRA